MQGDRNERQRELGGAGGVDESLLDTVHALLLITHKVITHVSNPGSSRGVVGLR